MEEELEVEDESARCLVSAAVECRVARALDDKTVYLTESSRRLSVMWLSKSVTDFATTTHRLSLIIFETFMYITSLGESKRDFLKTTCVIDMCTPFAGIYWKSILYISIYEVTDSWDSLSDVAERNDLKSRISVKVLWLSTEKCSSNSLWNIVTFDRMHEVQPFISASTSELPKSLGLRAGYASDVEYCSFESKEDWRLVLWSRCNWVESLLVNLLKNWRKSLISQSPVRGEDSFYEKCLLLLKKIFFSKSKYRGYYRNGGGGGIDLSLSKVIVRWLEEFFRDVGSEAGVREDFLECCLVGVIKVERLLLPLRGLMLLKRVKWMS